MLSFDFGGLLNTDFNVKNIDVYNIKFPKDSVIDYTVDGREKALLHLALTGKRYYKIKNKEFLVSGGNVIFIPNGTKYLTGIKETEQTEEDGCECINICFDITDNENKEVILDKDIYCLDKQASACVKNDFKQINDIQTKGPYSMLKVKSLLYDILHKMVCPFAETSAEYDNLKSAFDLLTAEYNKNTAIKYYAKLCGLSESCFRKKFTYFFGISPITYRNDLRFKEARRLCQMNVSVQEIAEKTGFYDSSHLSRLYKKNCGKSLKEDVKNI